MAQIIHLNDPIITEKTAPENEIRYLIFRGTDGKPYYVLHSKLLELFGGGASEISDINGLQAALDSKAATAHNHQIAEVTGLQTALDGKAATGHTHAMLPVYQELTNNTATNPVIVGPPVNFGEVWEAAAKMFINQNVYLFEVKHVLIQGPNGGIGFTDNSGTLGTIGTLSVGPVSGNLQVGFSPHSSVISTPKTVSFMYRRLC